MNFHRCKERTHWRDQARQCGFTFANNYWDESRYYSFSQKEIELVLHPAIQSLHDIYMELVDRVVGSEELLQKLQLPEPFWNSMRSSWARRDESLFGRFDLVYDGTGAPKMLEYNADTPCMVYETAYFQLLWLQETATTGIIPSDSGQYTTVQDEVMAFFRDLGTDGKTIYFGCHESLEVYTNLQYLMNCAKAAGHTCLHIYMSDLMISDKNQLTDKSGARVEILFKYYPWDLMLRDPFAYLIPEMKTKFIEPEWKMIANCKGMIPLLWEYFRGHPNLLPAYFSDDVDKPDLSLRYVEKPLYSREGLNVKVIDNGAVTTQSKGPYGAEGFILQDYAEIPEYDGHFPILGGWVINHKASGINIREGKTRVTGLDSRFAPHIVVN